MDASTWISLGAATISIVAAGISISQAASARKQAAAAHGDVEPTFHIERGASNGMPPWPFVIVVNNFNRRALEVTGVRVRMPGFLVYHDRQGMRGQIGAIIHAAIQNQDVTSFDFTKYRSVMLEGIAPNSGSASKDLLPFAFGPNTETKLIPDFVSSAIEVDWHYADEEKIKTNKLTQRFRLSKDDDPLFHAVSR